MDFRKLIMVALLSACSVSVMAAELWTDIYHERLTEAEQGSAEAQFEIGAMHENGRGVTADRDQAMQWYQKAADQHYDRAVNAIARMQDNKRRLEMTQSQAEAGDIEAQYKLGAMYLTGTGTGSDLKLAEQWLGRAAEKGHTKAQFKLGHLYYVELAEDNNMSAALNWFSKAAASDYSPAFYYLGDMYATGSGVTKDYAKARSWYEKAREGGFSLAVQALKELDDRIKNETTRRIAAETQAKEAAKQQATATTEATPAPPLDIFERLLHGQWLEGKRPVHFLPSKISECATSTGSLTCYSRELARKDLPQVHFKVKSIIRSADNESFKIVYRELVLQDFSDEFQGEDAELLQDTGIKPGWQEPNSMSCKFTASDKIACTREDGSITHYIGA